MAKKNLPVLQIEQFDHAHGSYVRNDHEFYANTLSRHLKHHHFIHVPHKHDFFLCLLFTNGKGTHEIDFTTYAVKPGSLFMMNPGQTHNWTLSDDAEGYIFFHSREFYEFDLAHERLRNFAFYQSVHASPYLQADAKQREQLSLVFAGLLKEFEGNKPLKMQRLHALVRLIYIDLSRMYGTTSKNNSSNSYLGQVREIEALVDEYFKTKKYPYEYALLLGMSEKHLNRICKTTLNKTTTELIAGRIILEAKRLLAQTKMNVAAVALELGYEDASYFIRFFRKNTRETPVQFMKRYRAETK